MLPVLSQSEADLTACFAQEMSAILDGFSEKDPAGKQNLQRILASDPGAFSRAAVRVLGRVQDSPGARHVVYLLRKQSLLMDALADPRGLKREEAIAAARVIPQWGAPIELDVERVLGATLSQAPSASNAARVLRLMDVLEAASPQPRFSLFQTQLLNYPDSAVRSRSTLLIAGSIKSAALVGRMLLDDDVQVQANAVEALWTFDAAEARPLLLQAARSKCARVAGNAAVGLYRMGDLSGLRMIFHMSQQDDPARRATAAWAMGETGDSRFLPALTARFPQSSGEERVNILQALGRIRRREKLLLEAGQIEVQAWSAKAKGLTRQLSVTLWSPGNPDLSALKATQVAIWDGGTLIHDYEMTGQQNPALAVCGFVLPRFNAPDEPYCVAAMTAITRCFKYKRAEDLWRIDRYLIEPKSGEPSNPIEKASLPYDEAMLGAFYKTQQRGFLASPEAIKIIMENTGAKERSAEDAIAAFERQSEALIRFPAKRRLFLFLSPSSAARMDRHIGRLTSFVANERITLHGIVPKGTTGCDEFEGLCLASDGGTFANLTLDEIPNEVERICAQSLNRYEFAYSVPEGIEPSPSGVIVISSPIGCGRASFELGL
jgi:HEAT repeat protein